MPETRPSPSHAFPATCLLLLLAVVAVYSNHFQNGFHFDDSHTIQTNPFVRSLSYLPRFFVDSRTMSSLPANQTYRPLLTTSLAVDYWLGRGLNPVAFHVSTFLLFLGLLAAVFSLYRLVLQSLWPQRDSRWIALFATAWFGLHPVSAETVNYIVQRADLHVALGIVTGLVLYAALPSRRRWGLYLVPVVLAGLSKTTAIIFPAFILLYALLVESAGWRTGIRRSSPSLGVAAILAWLVKAMTPANFSSASSPWFEYVITQPRVAAHYFGSFFLPLGLTADSDRKLLTGLGDAEALLGLLFVGVLAALAWWCQRSRGSRPVAFGLFWFLVAQIPTAVMPLAEVENDHRMFLPFIGLSFAAVCAGLLGYEWLSSRMRAFTALKHMFAAISLAVLGAYGIGAHQRNEVWKTEETLWKDVTIKSPRNGRGLMNYGLTQMGIGHVDAALDYFHRALEFTPNYPYLHVNLGIANGLRGRNTEAEEHFRRALALAPSDAIPRYFYGRWLATSSRAPEAVQQLRSSIDLNPMQLDARNLLMETYATNGMWDDLRGLAQDTLKVMPAHPRAPVLLEMARTRQAEPQKAPAVDGTPEQYLALSLAYHRAGQFQDCINAAQQALKLRPAYAEAYNNIAAGYESLGQWDQAIAAAQAALKIQPDFQLARNNLLYSQAQRARLRASHTALAKVTAP